MRRVRFVCRIPSSGVFWNFDSQQFDRFENALLVPSWESYLPHTDIRDIYRMLVQIGVIPIEAMEEVISDKWFLEYGHES